MANGLILLAFIALVVAIIWARARRRMGVPMTFRGFLVFIAVFIVAMLALWAYSTHG